MIIPPLPVWGCFSAAAAALGPSCPPRPGAVWTTPPSPWPSPSPSSSSPAECAPIRQILS